MILPPSVSNFIEYNTEYTWHKSQVASHKSQVTSRKSYVASHKSQVISRKSQVASHKSSVASQNCPPGLPYILVLFEQSSYVMFGQKGFVTINVLFAEHMIPCLVLDVICLFVKSNKSLTKHKS